MAYSNSRQYLLSVILLMSFAMVRGQDDYKAKSEEYYKMGMEVFDYAHRKQATDLFLLAIESDPDNAKAYFMAGKSILFTVNKEQSLPYFRRAFQLNPEVDNDILYYLGEAFHYSYQFDSAISSFLKYKYRVRALDMQRSSKIKQAERRILECRKAKVMVANPVPVKISLLGTAVNSEYPDYAPTVKGDGSLLIFTSRRPANNMNEMVADDYEYYEDIFYSENKDGVWQPAKNIGSPINTKYHDSNISLSPDGLTMFLYKDQNGGDIYVSHLDVQGKWSVPKPLIGINTEYTESSVSLSRDANTLYFTSDRPGGIGGLDIYTAQKAGGDKWNTIRNVGPSLNTSGDEEGVFISADGNSLFFSSDGYIGMGNLDLYRSLYDSVSKSWGKAENLGYPINSVENDIYFVLSADEQIGYISSVRANNTGYQDIYMLDMRNWHPFPEVEPIDTSLVLNVAPVIETLHEDSITSEPGMVKSNSATIELNIKPAAGQPVAETYAELLVLDSTSRETINADVYLVGSTGVLLPFRKHDGGGYSIRFPADSMATMGLRISSPGYESFHSNDFFSGVGHETLTFNETVFLSRQKHANVREIQLSTVYYGIDSDIPDSFDEIRKAIQLMKETPSLQLVLDGHADNTGPDEYNLGLSQRRADFVKNYMTARGVDAKRISAVAFGEQQPAASNETKASRRLNRRIEFRLVQPQ